MKRTLLALLLAGALALPAAAVLADAPPPTEGGNGGGKSGVCTGNPVDRPAVCPAT
jgi:hypothetical protein